LEQFELSPVLNAPLLIPMLVFALAALILDYFALGITLGGYLTFGRRVANAGRNVGQMVDRGLGKAGLREASAPRPRVLRDEDEDEDAAAPARAGLMTRLAALFHREPKPQAPRLRREPHFDGAAEPDEIDLPPAP